MQMKLKISVVLFLATCLAGFKANAQDEGQPQPMQEVQDFNQQHPELNLSEDKTLLMDADVKASKNQSAVHDGVNGVNNGKNKSDNSSKPSSNEKTEDPLSFNFIYFIIQKFKIS